MSGATDIEKIILRLIELLKSQDENVRKGALEVCIMVSRIGRSPLPAIQIGAHDLLFSDYPEAVEASGALVVPTAKMTNMLFEELGKPERAAAVAKAMVHYMRQIAFNMEMQLRTQQSPSQSIVVPQPGMPVPNLVKP
jgi:hypothetical protein